MASPPGQGDDPAIDEEAARAEIDRLTRLQAGELAVEVMDVFGTEGSGVVTDRANVSQAEIAGWLLRDYASGRRLRPMLRSAVRRACKVLVQAGLVEPVGRGFAVTAGGEADRLPDVLRLTGTGASALAGDQVMAAVLSYAMRSMSTAMPEPWEIGSARAWPEPGFDSDWDEPG